MKKQCKLLLLMLLIPFLGFSNDNLAFTKQKNIKKAYFVNADAGINIDNLYGNINVTTWDEDKIEIDVLIKVSGNNEKWVNSRINDIDIDIQALKNLVSAKTIMAKSAFLKNGKNNSIEVNYTIKIPKNGSIDLNNKYGNIITGDLINNANIVCEYGKITLGKLAGNTNKIQIEYCPNSNIDYIKNGYVEARYSGLKINEAVTIDLDTNYTDLTILESQNIKYDCNYGKFKFPKVNSLVGSGNYLTVDIGAIFNKLNLETHYSKITIGSINDKANNITIDAGYTDLSIGYDANYAFDFDIKTRFANFKNEDNLQILNTEGQKTSKQINGFYMKKGVNKLSVSLDYGNISLIKNSNHKG
jgi:hypothetical protein